jgi:hypothetical protein
MKINRRLFLLFAFALVLNLVHAQDSLSINKSEKKKFDFGISVSSFITPKVFGDDIMINHRGGRFSFGVNYFMNYHFSRHLGLTSGVGFSMWKNSFDYIFLYGNNISPDYDTASFTIKCYYLKMPINFLWEINPLNKVNCFVNFGVSPFMFNSGTYFVSGSPKWFQPGRMNEQSFQLFYNFNIGVKLPLYKYFAFTILFSYDNCFKSIHLSGIENPIYSKSGFLSLNLGIIF